jgi:hypothetical protein
MVAVCPWIDVSGVAVLICRGFAGSLRVADDVGLLFAVGLLSCTKAQGSWSAAFMHDLIASA